MVTDDESNAMGIRSNVIPVVVGDEVIYERQASSKTPRVSGCVVFTSASSEPEVKKPRIK